MAVTKITYENKEAIQNDASVANKSKVTDADMNEIKQVVNNNADEVTTMQGNIENLQSGQGTADADITSLKNRVSILETDNTQNKSDITTLKTDNETNKSDIAELQEQFSNFENYDDTEIKQDISEIKQEQQTQNSDIENLQTNDTKQDELISKLKSAALNAETEEAKSLHVMDANKFGQLEVLGNHEQETRSGKNLFKLPDSGNNNGITYTNNGDGTFNISGTATEQASFSIVVPLENSGFEQGKNYTISSNIEIGNVAYYVHSATSDGYWNKTLLDFRYETTKTKVMPEPSTDYISLNIVVPKDVTLNYQNVTVQIEEGTEATEYEQYGASPSPNYLSPVKCLGSNKNLLNTSLMIETTKGGVTSKINSDGSITFNGTCTTNNNVFDFYIENTTKFTFDAIKDQTTISAFYVSGSITDSNNSGAYFRVNDKSYAGGYINLVNLPQQKQLTRIYNSTSGSVFCDIRFNNGVVLDNFTIKCKAANTLEDAFTYSPPGQGSTLISKINKNIMPILNLGTDWECTEKGIKNIESNNGKEITNFFIKKGEKVEIGLNLMSKPSSESTFSFIKNGITDSSLNFTAIQNYTLNTVYKKTYMADEDTIISLKFWGNANNDTFEFQLWAEYNELTDYIKHQQTDYILNIQQEMLKGDYFVKEADGWKEVHNWDKIIFTGNENWKQSGGTTDDMLVAVISLSNGVDGFGYSNYFKYSSHFDIGCFVVYNGGSNIGFSVSKSEIATIDEFKSWLQEKYNVGNPVYAFYKTKTPTKLPCTVEQSAVLEELNNLDLFEGVNNIITVEDIALLKLKYALDVKTYVDNQLANVNAQILNIAGGN